MDDMFLDLVLNGKATAAEEAQLAARLRNRSSAPIAIVGNGPLHEEHRDLLNTFPAEQIVRMNAMNSLRSGEPTGRIYANSCSQGWWGVTTLVCPKAKEAVEIVLFGEEEKARENLLKLRRMWGEQVFLGLADGHELRIDGQNFSTKAGNGGFSIGFKSIAYTRWRFPNAKLHIFGMNWKAPMAAHGHPFEVEAEAIATLQNLEIHTIPADPDHWHGEHQYVCEAAEPPPKPPPAHHNVLVKEDTVKLVQESAQDKQQLAAEAWSLWAGEPLPVTADQCEDVECSLERWIRQ